MKNGSVMESRFDDRDTLISAEENRQMFDRIARNYDVASHAISLGMNRRWRRLAVESLAPVAGGRYLDIGTGTGQLPFEILRQQPGASVDGMDVAEQMLVIAREKVASLGLQSRIHLFVGDAHALPAGEGVYDGIILGFCYRNIAHRKQALGEILRVLKPGGRLVLLEASAPQHPMVKLGFRLYSPIIPIIGRVLGEGAAFRYLVDSMKEFPCPVEIMEQLRSVGVEKVERKAYTGGAGSVYVGRKPL